MCKFVNAAFCLGLKLESSLAFTFKGQHLAPYTVAAPLWTYGAQMRKSRDRLALSVCECESTYNICTYYFCAPPSKRHCANTLHVHCYRVRANVATKKQSATVREREKASILPFRRTRFHNLLRQKGLERFAPADASVYSESKHSQNSKSE